MIMVKLMGGLGNQLFQYATGFALAQRHDTTLVADTTALTKGKVPTSANAATPRHYELGHYNVSGTVATPADLGRVPSYHSLVQRILPWPPRFTEVKEKHYHFDPSILELADNVYLDGYWQSEKYFIDARPALLKEFQLVHKPNKANQALLKQIKATNAVSVHVRRGDYITQKAAQKYHGICSLDYYRDAIKRVAKEVDTPYFYVFSDDPAWCKQELKFKHPVHFMDHNSPDEGYEDIRLMQHCRYFILANSSFSWWGAWLAEDSGLVIAPKQWFKTKDNNTKDLIPKSWIRL